ncbi:MAG: response regulator [Candidatus Limnocylindria bacterium]
MGPGMGLSLSTPSPLPPPSPLVVVVEDDAALASIAEEVCEALGYGASAYAAPAAFLRDFAASAPDAVVLDWRLEREVGSAVFMAIRHRFPRIPVVCWTAMPLDGLPAMVRQDPLTRFVAKGSDVVHLEEALRWAVGAGTEP